LDELRTLVSQHSPHVICLCETWLDDSIVDDELFIPSLNLVRQDISRHVGGIALYIHDSIPFKVLLTHSHIELLINELTLRSCNLVCALIYRPPSSNGSVLSLLEDSLDGLPPGKSNSLLLLGDFKIDATPGINDLSLISIQAKHNLTQVITSPTRTTSDTATIIDHVYPSACLNHSHSVLPPLSSSDHACIQISLNNIRTVRSRSCQRKAWLYQCGDFESANDMLAQSLLVSLSHPLQWILHGLTGTVNSSPLCLTSFLLGRSNVQTTSHTSLQIFSSSFARNTSFISRVSELLRKQCETNSRRLGTIPLLPARLLDPVFSSHLPPK